MSSNIVKIAGEEVNVDDPCALYQALYAVKLKRLANEAIDETSFQSPVTRRMIKLRSVSIDDLDAELGRLAAACDAKNGKSRSRFAASFRY